MPRQRKATSLKRQAKDSTSRLVPGTAGLSPATLICRGLIIEVADTSYIWLLLKNRERVRWFYFCTVHFNILIIILDAWSPRRLKKLNSKIHSDHFYSASSSPLLLRGAPDTARIRYCSLTPKRLRQLRVKDSPKVRTWRPGRATRFAYSIVGEINKDLYSS